MSYPVMNSKLYSFLTEALLCRREKIEKAYKTFIKENPGLSLKDENSLFERDNAN